QTKPWRVFATITDITELKAAQDGHRLAAQRLQGVVNNTQAVIYQLDPEGRFLLSEGRDLATLGLSPGQVVGLSALDMYRDYPDTVKAIRQALAGEAGHVVLEVRGLFFDTHLSPVFDPDGLLESVIGVSTNITERVKTERALQENQQKFSRLFDLTPDLLTLARLSDGAFLDINQGFEKATGHKRSDIIGRSAIEIGLWREPADREKLIHAVSQQGECQGMEFVLNKKDGTPFHVLISAKTLEIQGEPCILVVAGDITQRVRTEQALRDSERNFRDLIHKLGEGFCLVDADEKFTFVNPAAEAIFGVGEGQLLGRSLLDFLDSKSSQKIRKLILKPRPGEKEAYELTIRRPNQEMRQILVNATSLVDANGRYAGANGVFQDITERRQAEDVLRQTQKLESLGVLAGGIAHDFNNLLTAILGNLNLAQTRIPENSEIHPFLQNAENTVLRAADLTKQMLAYSGKGHFVVTVHNLNLVVQEMTRLLQVSIPKKTVLRFQFTQDVLSIEADAAQIHQVVMNLVTNASEAIGQEKGAITLATHLEVLQKGEIPSAIPGETLPPGTYAVLEIADTGCGMGPKMIERIFDPFFSTKASGRGLGLSATLGILRGHKAGIRIQSRESEGSTITLYFPMVQETSQVQETAKEKIPAEFTGKALVVDDEPMVLEFTSQALETMKFHVTQAHDGLEAVEIFTKSPNFFDLVILDLTMPRMDGREALREIRRLRPNTPVILSSGYSDHEFLKDAASEKDFLFLQKPYQLKDLKQAVRNLLQPHET
ncbi:MAG: PAS domain S-box protein, partial [Holophaga sp.]|nr:PAS domain S-box protein [Holophaga sp.]